MAHFAYIWGGTLGGVASGTTITQAALHGLDINQFKAVNGDDGGSWAPATQITIGGSGLQVAGSGLQVAGLGLLCSGSAHFTSSAVFDAGIQVSGTTAQFAAATFSGTVGALSSLTVVGTLTAEGNANLGNNATSDTTTLTCITQQVGWLNCQGSVSIGSDASDSLEVSATETHYGDESHSGAITNAGTVTNNGAVVNNGSTTLGSDAADVVSNKSTFYAEAGGHLEFGMVSLDSATNHTVTAAQGMIVIQTPMVGNGTLVLSTAGMGSYYPIKFVRSTDTTNQLAVQDGTGGTLVLLGGGTTYNAGVFYFNGTRWQTLMLGH